MPVTPSDGKAVHSAAQTSVSCIPDNNPTRRRVFFRRLSLRLRLSEENTKSRVLSLDLNLNLPPKKPLKAASSKFRNDFQPETRNEELKTPTRNTLHVCCELRDHHDIAALQQDVFLQILPLSHIAISEGKYLLLAFHAPDNLDVIFRSKGCQPSG